MLNHKLTIVSVNYNSESLLLDLLNSIKNSTNIDFGIKVIVVDNASNLDSLERLKKIKWITLIGSDKNLGFSGGNNLAVPYIEGEYVWFLNPDTYVEPDTISFMVKYMDNHREVGVATPKLVLPNGTFDKNCHRGFPTPWNSLCHFLGLGKLFPRSKSFSGYYMGNLSPTKEAEVDVVGGSSLLVRREVGEQIGWWDESYFMYGEDIAFTYEVKKRGYKVMYVPQVIVHHHHGASSGLKKSSSSVTRASKETKLKSTAATIAAMRIFYNKYYSGKYPFLLTNTILLGISVVGSLRIIRIKLFG